MEFNDHKELLDTARERFIEGDYATAEGLLQQVMLKNAAVPELYQILGTIYYDQGKFNKAIKHFKRALEIDPNYTDASVGLSIILNDLGRYEEGREVFETAQRALPSAKQETDMFVSDKIAQKHLELGDLYFQSRLFEDAIDQFGKALNASGNRPEVRMRLAECHHGLGDTRKAIHELRVLTNEQPSYIAAQVRLGTLLYETKRIPEAIEMFERVLMRDPMNGEAKRYLEQARRSDTSALF